MKHTLIFEECNFSSPQLNLSSIGGTDNNSENQSSTAHVNSSYGDVFKHELAENEV